MFLDNIGQVTLCIGTKLKEANKAELKLERMKLPTFDGDICSFPRFKSDSDRYVKPSVSPDSCSYVLKLLNREGIT